jgi:hypothetical protein
VHVQQGVNNMSSAMAASTLSHAAAPATIRGASKRACTSTTTSRAHHRTLRGGRVTTRATAADDALKDETAGADKRNEVGGGCKQVESSRYIAPVEIHT